LSTVNHLDRSSAINIISESISTMSNLYELSIQLRKLQADKNEKANEIDRLERQLRILSELKGISVSDLQHSLREACEAEAHGELRALVGTLQARVDGLRLGGRGGGAGGGTMVDEGNKVPSQERFNQEAAARARAALELRIGELEEIDSNLRLELDAVYRGYQTLTEKNTLLETQLLHQKAQLEQWESRWKAKEEEEIKRSSIVPVTDQSSGSYNFSEFAKPSEPTALVHVPSQSQIDVENRLIAAETALNGEKQQRAILQSQLTSAQKTYQIKEEQYQHRIQFFEEQVRDLEQQLSSLYTAFGIMQDDSKVERSEMEVWKNSLLESDAALAKEEAVREAKKYDAAELMQPSERVSEQSIIAPHKSSDLSHRRTVKKGSRRSVTKAVDPPSLHERSAVQSAANEPIATGVLLLLLDNEGKPLQPNANPSPSTPRQRSFLGLKTTHSTSEASNKFTKQYCVLHGANGLYQLRYGESYTSPVSGVHEFITAGVSSVEVSSLTFPFSIRSSTSASHSSKSFMFSTHLAPPANRLGLKL
jgi:hypothetical protein